MPELLVEYRTLIANVYELAGRSRATSEALASEVGQSAARWHLLSVVSDEPHTVPNIAERLGQARQSVQRVANDLEAEQLVEFVDNPAHRRSPHVTITSRGRDLVTQLFERSEEMRRQELARSGMTAAQIRSAGETVAALIAALDSTRHQKA